MKIKELFEGKFVEPFTKSGKPNPNHPSFEKNKAKYDAEKKAERVVKVKETAAEKAKKLDNALVTCSNAFMADGWGELDSTDVVRMKIIPAIKKRIKADPDKYSDDFKDAVQKTGGEWGTFDALYKYFDQAAKKYEKVKDFNAYVDQVEADYKELMKEGYSGDNTFNKSSRADWDPNMTDYQGDYGGSKNWGHREREDDERHDLDKWYLRVNGQVYSRFGKPVAWDSRALANSYGHTLQGEHPDWKIMLTQSPV